MGRFSAWAESKVAEDITGQYDAKQVDADESAFAFHKDEFVLHFQEEWSFLVDNREIKSKSKGLMWRRSPCLEDKEPKWKGATFGTVVTGLLSADGAWLKVGKRYLPVTIGDKRVLLPAWSEADLAELSGGSEDEDSGAGEEQKRWGSIENPEPTRPVLFGEGANWEVVTESIFLRAAPGPQARVAGARSQGQVLELFDWDSSRRWRRALCTRTFLQAWVMLDHPKVGPLLRPQGRPFSVRPPVPLCEAAREGCAADVGRFVGDGPVEVRDVDGKSPLQIAAEAGHLECCLLLFAAGQRLAGTAHLALPGSSAARALIAAASGFEFDAAVLDEGLETLPEQAQLMADRLINEAMTKALAPPQLPPAEDLKLESRAVPAAEDVLLDRPPLPKAMPLEQEERLGRFATEEAGRTQPAESPQDAQASRVAAVAAGASPAYAAGAQTDGDQEPRAQAAAPAAQAAAPTVVADARGLVYEVVYKAVFVREQPSGSAATVSCLKRGDMVDVLDYDASRAWGRVQVQKPKIGLISGWVLLEHADLGTLLRQR